MIENEQVYMCKACGAMISEKDMGCIRVHDYYRLYCPLCQSEEVKIILVEE